MAGHSINLEHRQFSSNKDATIFFKAMLERYSDGDIVLSDDKNLLFDLVHRHPEVEDKIGLGISDFYRDKSPDYPTSCFHIRRVDGTTTDFSYGTCIKNANPTLFQDFYSACHNAIRPRLIEEKEQLFRNPDVCCAITGEVITIDDSEYRHTQPRFIEIVNSFIISEKLEIINDMIVENKDMQYATSFKNQLLENKFKEFHLENANFEIVKKYIRR